MALRPSPRLGLSKVVFWNLIELGGAFLGHFSATRGVEGSVPGVPAELPSFARVLAFGSFAATESSLRPEGFYWRPCWWWDADHDAYIQNAPDCW